MSNGERIGHMIQGLTYFAGWLIVAPVCSYLAFQAKRELRAAQAGLGGGPYWAAKTFAKWRQTAPPPRVIVPDPPPAEAPA